jgi:hypothetical protein
LRTSSITFSSASVSAREVDDVAAIAAGVDGLRAGGGNAACWRVAGVRTAEAGAAAVSLAAVFGSDAVFFAAVLDATWRAIGRGFGNGTFGLAHASAAQADKPTVSARLVANAVDRNAAAREDEVTGIS